MKLHEFINTTLTDHNGLFKTKMFQDGLRRYLESYIQWKQNLEVWKTPAVQDARRRELKMYQQRFDQWKSDVQQGKADPKGDPEYKESNPCPAHLSIDGNNNDDADARAISAARLAVLHDHLKKNSPATIPTDWPDDCREALKANVLHRYDRHGQADISDGWGLVLAEGIREAVDTLLAADDSPDWNDPAYITAKEALTLSEGRLKGLYQLNKILKSGKHNLRYIQNETKSRCKVHSEDFRVFLKKVNANPDYFSGAAFAKYYGDAEKTKKTIRQENVNRR